jgi:DNA-binding transcriptional ArsR family regulator
MVDYSAPEHSASPTHGADLDSAYAALSNGVRRAIVQQLVERDRRVTELARPFDVSLQAVSKHIRVLESAGLVRRRIDGRDHWLSLDPSPLAYAGRWIENARRFWEARLDALDEVLTGLPNAGSGEDRPK